MSDERNRFDVRPAGRRPAFAVIGELDEESGDAPVGQPRRHVARQREIGAQDVQDDDTGPPRAGAERTEVLGVDDVVLGIGRRDRRGEPQARDRVSRRLEDGFQLVAKHGRLQPEPLGDR